MKFRKLLAIPKRWWLTPLAVGAIALMVGAAVQLRLPHYSASAVVLAPAPANANGQSLYFPDVATTAAVADRALRDTHESLTAAQLQAVITVTASRSTLYTVTVAAASAAEAEALDNAVAREATSLYSQLAGGAATSLVAQLQVDEGQYRLRAEEAAQALRAFEQAHPFAASSPTIAAELGQLQLDQQAAQTAYINLETAIAQARVDQVKSANDYLASIIDPAVAQSQVRSLVLRALFAGLVGLLVGASAIVIYEYVRAGRRQAVAVAAAPVQANGHQQTPAPVRARNGVARGKR